MSKGKGWIDVITNKRSYSAKGNGAVVWEKGEKVVKIEPHDDKSDGKQKGK